MRRAIWVGVGSAALLWAVPGFAAVLNLAPSADNTLFEASDGSLSSGSGGDLYVGMTNSNNRRRGLIRFDVGAIPAGSVVTAVTLSVQVTQAGGGGFNGSLTGVHAVTNSWGEGGSVAFSGTGAPSAAGDATWLHRFYSTTPWANPGGDFAPATLASTTLNGAGAYAWSSAGLASSVQGWVDAPSTNFGWILIGDELTLQSARKIASRENANPAFRPVLTIQYSPAVPEPAGGQTAVSAGAAALLGRRRTRAPR